MAIPTNAYTTYDAVGIREDLINIITNISPVDTWFTSNSGTGRARQLYHEWQTDTLAAAASNVQIQGGLKTATAITPTTRTGNYVQTLSKEFLVNEEMDIVEKAGRTSETAYQTDKKYKELAKDIEYALLINSTSVSGDTATGAQLKGVLGWITTNVNTGTATGNTTTLLNTAIQSTLQLVWAEGGQPSTLLVGGFQKQKISALTTSNTKFVQAPSKTVIDAVDVYDTDFGRLQVKLSRVLDGTSNATKGTILIFGDMNLWVKAWLKEPKKTELPVAATSHFYTIECALTLESRQEKGSGKMNGLAIT